MRLLLCLLLCCAGCTHWIEPSGAMLAANAASIVVFGRGVFDIAYSGVTGRDCSVVRLDQGRSYCAPAEPPPAPPAFCTRSLGVVDCWSNPDAFAVRPREVADQPALTALQERNRVARWPKALTAEE